MASRPDALAAGLLRNRRFVRAPIWLYQHGFGRPVDGLPMVELAMEKRETAPVSAT
jgi:hypothetical protein